MQKYNKAFAGAGGAGVSVAAVVLAIINISVRNFGLDITPTEAMILAGAVSVIASVINGALVYAIPNKDK